MELRAIRGLPMALLSSSKNKTILRRCHLQQSSQKVEHEVIKLHNLTEYDAVLSN